MAVYEKPTTTASQPKNHQSHESHTAADESDKAGIIE